MTQPRPCSGIDVAQDERVVAERPAGTVTRWANDEPGPAALVAHRRTVDPGVVVLEGTGGLEDAVAATGQAAGRRWWPTRARCAPSPVGRLATTDPIAAAVLAHSGAVVRPRVRPRPAAATQELAALVARRRQVRDRRVAERNRRGRLPAVVPPLARSPR